MKGRMIVLDHLSGREAAALLVDGHLHDLLIAPAANAPLAPGTICRAVVERPLKGQGGVIVRLPTGQGFLRNARGRAQGQSLLVQVTSVVDDTKAVPVTDRILFKSRYAIVTPGAPGRNVARGIRDEETRGRLSDIAREAMMEADPDLGVILRSACATASDDDILEDITEMRALAEAVLRDAEGPEPELLIEAPTPHETAWREWADPEPDAISTEAGGFDTHGVLDALDALGGAHHALPRGAGMFVEPTRALVAVDVNTGGDTSPAAGLKSNIAAAQALPRALRLRGLAGQIVVDFAPMPKKDRKQLEQTLRAAFRSDSVETNLVGWTPLGHFELQRKRDRFPLSELLPA